jgi:DMSO reductase family type II enzyme chaperone
MMTPEVTAALCRSALYEVLALGFRPPSAEVEERLATPAAVEGLVYAATFLDPELGPLVRRLVARAPGPGALAADYTRLFGHTVRGQVPAFETEYGVDDMVRQPHELADLGGFYAAFGLRVAPGAGERPDHVRCECEFLMVLARREAVACEQDDEAARAAAERATRLFLRDHLGRFAPALGERLERADPDGFYGALGALARAVVVGDCRRFRVDAGPASLPLRDPSEDPVPMACGGCALVAGSEPGDDGD